MRKICRKHAQRKQGRLSAHRFPPGSRQRPRAAEAGPRSQKVVSNIPAKGPNERAPLPEASRAVPEGGTRQGGKRGAGKGRLKTIKTAGANAAPDRRPKGRPGAYRNYEGALLERRKFYRGGAPQLN